MKIAIDYDDTITLNKQGWAKTISFLQNTLKAEVRIVTFRCKGLPGKSNPDIDNFLTQFGVDIPVIYTEGRQKSHVCANLGWNPDVWIDDNPSTIASYSSMKGMVKGCEVNNDKGLHSDGLPPENVHPFDILDAFKNMKKNDTKIVTYPPKYIPEDWSKHHIPAIGTGGYWKSPMPVSDILYDKNATIGAICMEENIDDHVKRLASSGAGQVSNLGGAGVIPKFGGSGL